MSVVSIFLLLLTSTAWAVHLSPDVQRRPAALVSLLSTHGSSEDRCRATCNGDDVNKEEASDASPMYECWGDFELTCQSEEDSHTAHTEFKCKGIFSAHVHGDHKDHHSLYTYHELPQMLHLTSSDHDKAKPLMFVLCEGTSTSFMKGVHQSDHGHHDGDEGNMPYPRQRNTQDVLQSNHESEGDLAVSHFSMSVGVMKVLVLNITGGGLGGGSYEPAHITIDSHKRFSKGTAVSSILQEMDNLRLDVEHEAYRTSKSMHTPPMSPAWNVEEEVPQSQLQGSPRKVGRGRAEQLTTGEGKDVDIKCSNTCNGKPTSWGGWWPCWGEMKYSCTGCGDLAEGGCFKTEGNCEGLSWPAMMSCKGTYMDRTFATNNVTTGGDKGDHEHEHGDKKGDSDEIKVKSEFLELTTGFRKASKMEKDGWHMMVQGASGHSADRWKWMMHGGKHHEKKSSLKWTGNAFADPVLSLKDVDDI